MSMVTSSRIAILALLFQNIAWANIGDAGGLQPSATAGSFYISLHTAPVGASGSQTTNETTYTGYVRIAVARSNGAWVLTSPTPSQVANIAAIVFGTCTAGAQTITDFAVGRDVSGAGQVIATGALDTSLVMAIGSAPQFPIGDLTVNVT